MSFSDKIAKIEQARILYPEFNSAFIEYLGLGNSFNGAYNHFSLEDLKQYEPKKITAQIVKTEATIEPAAKTITLKTATVKQPAK